MKDPQSSDSDGHTASRQGWPLADMADKFKSLSVGLDLTFLDPAPLLLPRPTAAAEKRRTVLGATSLHH